MRNISKPPVYKFAQFLLAASLSLPLVLAQRIGNTTIPRFMETGFRGIFNALGREAIQAGATLVLFLITIYAITLAGVKRIKTFQDGDKISKSGKIFAFSFSMLATLGLFFGGRRSFYEVVHNVLEATSVLGMVVLGLIIGMLVYFGFKQKDDKYPCAALAAAGLAFIIPSYIMEWQGWYSFGWLMLIIGGIWCLFKMFGKGTGSGNGPGGDRPGGDRPGGDDPRGGEDPEESTTHGTLVIEVTDVDDGSPISHARVYTERRGGAWNPWNWTSFGALRGRVHGREIDIRGYFRFEGYTDDNGHFELDPTRIGNKGVIVTRDGYVDPRDASRDYVRTPSRTVSNQDRTIPVQLKYLGNLSGVNIEVEYRYPAYGIGWINTLFPHLCPVHIRIRRVGGDFHVQPGDFFEIIDHRTGTVFLRVEGSVLNSTKLDDHTYIIYGAWLPPDYMNARFNLH